MFVVIRPTLIEDKTRWSKLTPQFSFDQNLVNRPTGCKTKLRFSGYFSTKFLVEVLIPPSLQFFTMVPTSSNMNARKKMESLKFVGGSKLMKELQKTMFFAAYESVVFSSARSMTEKDQRKMLRESIVGTSASDIMTLPEQMVLGLNQFSHLYDDVPVVVNDDRNASTLSAAAGTTVVGSSRHDYDKVLKDCFSRRKLLEESSMPLPTSPMA